MSEHDFNVYIELRADLREALKTLQTQMGTIALQLGAWLVVGNAAGIYFLANAAVDDALVLDARFAHTYVLFLIGAALAFGALCFSYFVSIPAVAAIANAAQDNIQLAHHDQLRAGLEAKNVPPPPEWEQMDKAAVQRLEATQRKLQRIWWAFGLAVGIYALSALCFLIALATPLLGGLTLG